MHLKQMSIRIKMIKIMQVTKVMILVNKFLVLKKKKLKSKINILE